VDFSSKPSSEPTIIHAAGQPPMVSVEVLHSAFAMMSGPTTCSMF
jgi:hypothetical protein